MNALTQQGENRIAITHLYPLLTPIPIYRHIQGPLYKIRKLHHGAPMKQLFSYNRQGDREIMDDAHPPCLNATLHPKKTWISIYRIFQSKRTIIQVHVVENNCGWKKSCTKIERFRKYVSNVIFSGLPPHYENMYQM